MINGNKSTTYDIGTWYSTDDPDTSTRLTILTIGVGQHSDGFGDKDHDRRY
jgi:hypothetical protein